MTELCRKCAKMGFTPSTVCGGRTPSTAAGNELLPPSADGPPPSKREVLGEGESGVGRMSAEIATVRCICNAGLHHCNGWMHLQPLVAPPSSVGARIARPFIPDVITTLREGARRVIGATAKPLYPIDGKAEGLDRRNPRPPSSREGDRPRRWKEFSGGRRSPRRKASNPFFKPKDCKKTDGLLYYNIRSGLPSAVPAPHPSSERTWQREKAHPPIFGHPRRVRPDFC